MDDLRRVKTNMSKKVNLGRVKDIKRGGLRQNSGKMCVWDGIIKNINVWEGIIRNTIKDIQSKIYNQRYTIKDIPMPLFFAQVFFLISQSRFPFHI